MSWGSFTREPSGAFSIASLVDCSGQVLKLRHLFIIWSMQMYLQETYGLSMIVELSVIFLGRGLAQTGEIPRIVSTPWKLTRPNIICTAMETNMQLNNIATPFICIVDLDLSLPCSLRMPARSHWNASKMPIMRLYRGTNSGNRRLVTYEVKFAQIVWESMDRCGWLASRVFQQASSLLRLLQCPYFQKTSQSLGVIGHHFQTE